ncbi:MAG TPA: hypothetical protein VM711_09270 [Sphingomicrobium sp.]|nr:hypothetical protein [Sphingomicrobium sp.]
MWDGDLRRPVSVQVEALLNEAANCRLLAGRLAVRRERDFVQKLAEVFEELARLRTRRPKTNAARSNRALSLEDLGPPN